MELTAEKTDLNMLLGIPGVQFRVPEYQRPYSWGDQQIDQAWDDLIGSLDGRHFFGSIVLNVEDTSNPQVIDGQQRLATLVALLALIRDEYVANESPYAGQPDQLLRNAFQHGDAAFKLKVGNSNWSVFRDYVLRPPSDDLRRSIDDVSGLSNTEKIRNKRLIANVRRLRKRLREFLSTQSSAEAGLLRLEQHIRTQLDIVAIRVGSVGDAFLLFETLNDRGLQLSAADLLKSHILSRVAQAWDTESMVHDASIEWDDMLDRLNGVDVTRYLRHYLLMSRSKVRKDDVFDYFKDDVLSVGAVELLARLYEYSRHYGDLLNPSRLSEGPVRRAIRDINGLNSISHFVMLLPARATLDDAGFIRLCRLAEILSFRWIVAGQNAQVLESIYASAALILDRSEGSQSSEAEALLIDAMPGSEVFRDRFRFMTMGVKYVTRYILRRIEEQLHANAEIEIIGPEEVHIEHIMPKTSTSYWADALNGDFDEYDQIVGRLGNLTLLHSRPNVQIANGPFEVKSVFYAESDIKLTRQLVGLDSWNDDMIDDRQRWMAEVADFVWSVAGLDTPSWVPPPFPRGTRGDDQIGASSG